MSVLDQASLVLIPSGYKASKLYSVVPTSGAGDLSFSRSTTATRINESGLIESVGVNVPRIDFTGGGCGKALLEPQRTNNLAYSNDFTNAAYIKDAGVTIGSTSEVSPSGDSDASRIDVTNSGRIYNNTTSNTWSSSVFLKAGTFSYFELAGQKIDLVLGTIVGDSNTIKNYGNGWYRCSIQVTTTRPFQVIAYPNSSYSSHTDSGNYYMAFAQEELGSYPTSYIPTAGSAVTRTQDLSSTTGLSSVINSVEGVFYIKMAAISASTNDTIKITISDGSNNNSLTLSYNNSGRLDVNLMVGGVFSFIFNYASITSEDVNSIAVRWKANDFSLWVNGVSVLTDTSGSVASADTFDRLNFSNPNSASDFFYGKISDLVLAEYLTDTQMAELTTL